MMTWLHRSAACALSLHAQVQSTGLENVPLFFEFLDAYRLRWRDLRLVLPFSWARVAIHILDRPTPLLEVLRMRVAKSHDNLLPVPEISFLLTDISAPHLRYLCWGITGPNRVRFLPQLSRLEDLDVDYEISVTECLDILQQCLGLVSCEFWRIKIVQSDAAKLNSRCIITHPRLRSFSLHSTVVTDLLLEYLTLPALIKLKVAVIRDTSTQIPNTWSQPRFNSFFARSAPPLQHLILQDALPSEEALIQCLECVSVSLIELIVLDTDGIFVMRDGVLALLTVRQDGDGHATCLCPRLEALRFGRSLLSTDGLLADMVESRWRRTWPDTIARLRSINPCISITDHPNDVRRLTTLRDKGLHWS
ncbi:hypothetical protein APHAL10511_001280 [Amanita phalloides]|nr:hypothetical protein APHAL10511_001280 [Amanita phalloides]